MSALLFPHQVVVMHKWDVEVVETEQGTEVSELLHHSATYPKTVRGLG